MFFLYTLHFFCVNTFIFNMANQSFLNVNWTIGNQCIHCNQVVKNEEKWEDVTVGILFLTFDCSIQVILLFLTFRCLLHF